MTYIYPKNQRQWDQLWAIELKAEQLFMRDNPAGKFARRLPQFGVIPANQCPWRFQASNEI